MVRRQGLQPVSPATSQPEWQGWPAAWTHSKQPGSVAVSRPGSMLRPPSEPGLKWDRFRHRRRKQPATRQAPPSRAIRKSCARDVLSIRFDCRRPYGTALERRGTGVLPIVRRLARDNEAGLPVQCSTAWGIHWAGSLSPRHSRQRFVHVSLFTISLIAAAIALLLGVIAIVRGRPFVGFLAILLAVAIAAFGYWDTTTAAPALAFLHPRG